MQARKVTGIVLAVLILTGAAAVGTLLFFNLNAFKPLVTDRLGEQLGRPVAVNGDLELVWTLPPALAAGDVSLGNASWGEAPQMAGLSRIEVVPRWSALIGGRLTLARINVRGARVTLARNAKGQWNLPRPERGNEAQPQTSLPALPTFHLTDSHLRLQMPAQTHELQVDALTLSFGEGEAGARASGRVRYAAMPLDLTLTLSPAKVLFGNPAAATLTGDLKTGRNRLAIKGTLTPLQARPQLDLQFDLDAPDLSEIVHAEHLPAGFENRLQASGRLHDTSREGRYRISELQVEAGTSDAEGWIELAPFADPLQMTAELSAQRIDLRPYLPESAPSPEAEAKAPSEISERVFGTTPFPEQFLPPVDLDATVTVKTLLLPALALEDLEATVSLREERLDLDPLAAAAGGGRLDARVHLLGSGEQFQLRTRGEVHRLDLGAMLQTLDLPPSLQGELGLQFDLQGRGASPAELAGGLDGRFSLAMQGGRIARRYLRKAEAYGFELTSAFVELLKPGRKEATEFVNIDCAVARFEIEDGVAESNVLVFDTARAGVVGDGQIDLGEERFNIALKPVTEGGIGIPGLVKLKVGTTVADAFKLGGTFKSPVISLDKSESALSLGKAIGGMLLFGPAGLTAGLLEAEFGSGNPCVKALQQAEMIASPGDK